MQGLMMDAPLLITSIMQHAERSHAQQEIISAGADAQIARFTFAETFSRVRQLANFLAGLGLSPGDRIATLAWNDQRHLEAYYAISCSGYVCHTVNPRLFEEDIAYIINDAEDQCVFVDPMFVPLIEKLSPRLPSVKAYIVMGDARSVASSALPVGISYDSAIAGQPSVFDWPELDERAASSLCYTSGTTGSPKGVLYSHRSTVLHAYAQVAPDVFGLSAREVVMPAVPMFHVNAWGLPYSVPMVGAKLVLPGAAAGNPQALHDLIIREDVTFAAGVPTVWLGVLEQIEHSQKAGGKLQRIVSGGAAVPAVLMQRYAKHGVTLIHAWGMTELSPVGTVNAPTSLTEQLSPQKQAAVRLKQGRPPFGVQLRICDEENREVPRDGVANGFLKVRGSWVCSGYFKQAQEASHNPDGWFDTGDVASIDPDGFMQIVDRRKDLIKSGGEWISSVVLENLAMEHPAVAEAAAIGEPHEKWQERPVLAVVLRKSASASAEELLALYRGRVASWWIPDRVVFLDQLPHTATGKISKRALRVQLGNC